MLHWLETIVFTAVLLTTIYAFYQAVSLRYRLVKTGQPEDRFDQPVKRAVDAVTSFFFLRCSVKKERYFTGFVHLFILYGSLTFDTVSINHVLEGYGTDWNLYGHGWVRAIHSAWADVFGIIVILATLYFIIRRYVMRPDYYTYPSAESAWIYTLLITVTVTFFLYEAADIALSPQHGYEAFAGKAMAGWLAANFNVTPTFVKITWWIHILNVFAFVAYVPRSKYMHMFAGPINIAFRDYQSTGFIKPLEIDIETAEKFGVVDIKDFTWKDLSDGFACIDCGRCDDYCPAFRSGKPLSPKNLILKVKDHLLANKKTLLGKEGEAELTPLMGETYSADEIWTCTSCGACVHVCPVKNEHIRKIIGLRQSKVLMESEFPEEMGQFFRNMETNANPWGFGAATKGEWAEDLDIKTLANDAAVDILYWVGCAGSFDERSKKVSYAMVKILQTAGINFGILGQEESCCGDQARRLGNEYMFQMMAQETIETLKRYNIKKMLVTCPHGYNTFKNEYPVFAKTLDIDWDIEVIHHSEFIEQLIKDGKLTMKQSVEGTATFHDPCYLGRHNEIFDAPREVIAKSGASLKEMKNNHHHSFCCGAGGGLMWTEEHLGTRINHMRTDNALEAETDIICTSCPFCMTMMEDGVKDKEEDRRVRDIAELVSENI